MTLELDQYFDELRVEQQSQAAEELFLEGDTDGYVGNRPANSDLAYLAGYFCGSRRKSEELLAALRELLGIKAELEPTQF